MCGVSIIHIRMNLRETFKKKLFGIDHNSFDDHALELFKYQAKNNQIYNQYILNLGIDTDCINNIYEIPYLPVNFFKTQKIITGNPGIDTVFISSGTTNHPRSKHYIADLQFYLKVCEASFKVFYGDVSEYTILTLLPSYLPQFAPQFAPQYARTSLLGGRTSLRGRSDSSLICMVDHFISKSKSHDSGFIIDEKSHQLLNSVHRHSKHCKKMVLIGITFALLDQAEKYSSDLSDVIIMETGGMKGRRKEMIREQVHEILKKKFAVNTIHSEYGMTELFSQAYSKGEGKFKTPPWMKILIREINDPFNVGDKIKSDCLPASPGFPGDRSNRQGGINIIDLANVDSCAFIETEDLGRINNDGTFEILGRIDNTDLRGCNLMID